MWVPVAGGPAFLLGPNFYSVKSYNPSMNYALAICHLGDRILGAPPFIQPFPGSERALTLAEVQEIQTRLTKAGFDTGGTDGRVGNDTMKAVRDYQSKMGLLPADGYGGLKVLARLRQGVATVSDKLHRHSGIVREHPALGESGIGFDASQRAGMTRTATPFAATPPAFMPPSMTSSVPVT